MTPLGKRLAGVADLLAAAEAAPDDVAALAAASVALDRTLAEHGEDYLTLGNVIERERALREAFIARDAVAAGEAAA